MTIAKDLFSKYMESSLRDFTFLITTKCVNKKFGYEELDEYYITWTFEDGSKLYYCYLDEIFIL